MRVKLAALVISTLALAVVLTACDNFATYTVVNETNEELITWPLFEDCKVIVGNKADYLHEEVIRPFETLDYFDVHGEPRLSKCVQVVTRDRQLVLSEPYEDGGIYTVTIPLQPLGDSIPARGDLPGRSISEFLRETPPALLVVWGLGLVFGLGVFAAFLFALFITVRFFYRHYTGKS